MLGRIFKRGGGRRFSRSGESDRGSLSVHLAWLGLAVGLLSFAAGLLALILTLDQTTFDPLFMLGVGASSLAGAWILLVYALKWSKSARGQIGARKEYEYKQLGADLRYLEEIVSSGRRAIGAAHPGAETVMGRLTENSEVLKVYGREKANGRSKFCGYVLLYPLEESAGKAIMAGEIRSEAEFGPNPLCANSAEAPYLYIGMVLGTDRHAQSYVRDKLRDELIRILSSGKVKRVFARPGTQGILELMQHYGFLPIGAERDVWSTSGPQLMNYLRIEGAMSTTVMVTPDPKPAQQPDLES